MTETRWWQYVSRITPDGATATEVADKAGFDKSAMTRWKNGSAPDPYFVVKLARAYERPVKEALVEAGLITEEEAALTEVEVGADDALRGATDGALLEELRQRLANVGGNPEDAVNFEPEAPRRDQHRLAAKRGTRKIDQ